MNNQQQQKGDNKHDKFTWTIKNFSRLNTKKLYSETFLIGGYPWRLLLFPKGNNVDYLSIYLDVADSSKLPSGWERGARFKVALINQVKSDYVVGKETRHQFNARESDWGFTSFISLRDFSDPSRGYLLNDTCIIQVEISVLDSANENQVDQATSTTVPLDSGDQARQMEMEPPQQENLKQNVTASVPLSSHVSTESIEPANNLSLLKGMSSTPTDELIDFRGLGKIEAAFVPLLEQVCSQYPSLIDCQRKRSRRFTEWAFIALGRVLHFLKTKKGKDMNDDACNHLQILWEELETFRFDLTWLEPHVQSALGMKSYLERAMQVKKLKENVSALEMERKRLKAELASAEVDLEVAKRHLAKAEEDLQERDMDVELGYGHP
ncbi:hypothetical protein L6164_033983 [Bauhinia variegata]|uniref:Uncharacterized protein n=2 Tax=Bauhinia variegata TaxID=167791 RepID=A0ACB9KTH7_BAUVA|nr:hypothetical protein L6164_033983 [Bauhinia variegata]